MPASLRPNLLATITLATTVSMTGCIFPFTRSSDTKLAEMVAEDAQPQPKQEVAAAPKPAGEKKMPPFARFLGGMFGSESTPQSEPDHTPVNVIPTEPTQRVAELPTKTPTVQPSTIQPAQDLVTESQSTPIFHPKTNQMPVIVTPETNQMADKPDVVSTFTQKATQLTASPRPEVVVEPTQTTQAASQSQSTPQVAPAPQVAKATPAQLGDEALDAHARAPWAEKKLLEKAMANNSTSTTTLEHSLDLALETVRQERLGQISKAESPTPKPELTAHTEVDETPLTQAQVKAPSQSTKVAANPLRSSSSKTDWTGSSLRSSEPETIVNDTVSKYPQTNSNWTPKLESSQSAPEEVAKQVVPSAEPQVTVNPYAKIVEESIAVAPTPSPQLVDNTKAVGMPANEQPKTTDDIHFQSSLLNKLQAANSQAKWDFNTSPEQPEPTPEDVSTENAMPQIVENNSAEPNLPLIAARQTESPTTHSTVAQPKTTINPSVAQAEPKEDPQVIKPFIIAEPARAVPPRRGLIRAAEPQPLVMENQDGNWQTSSPANAKQLPKLAPVVRASDYQQPAPQSSGSKTYIVN